MSMRFRRSFGLDDNLDDLLGGPRGIAQWQAQDLWAICHRGNFFYNHYLFANLKPTTEYLMATRKGEEFPSSNHLSFTWSGDKVSSVEIVD